MKKILIVGSGFSGAVLAHEFSTRLYPTPEILVLDERSHIGGNCHTERDPSTGIMVHVYGPHIFHTSNEKVWNYVNSFCKFKPFVNRVKAKFNGSIYSLPINLHTINQFFNKCYSPNEAKEWILSLGDSSIVDPISFEEQALKFIGRDLYNAFFYGYTKKQWGCEPSQLPASILKRLPIRFNYDDNYYNDNFQGIPEEGYSSIIYKMLHHSNIQISLNTKFSVMDEKWKGYDYVFYTGPIDEYFNFSEGRLGYRTVTFEKEEAVGDFQGNPVINYCDENIPYTRIHEHKHFSYWENFEKTIYFKEYSKETEIGDIPYYPKRLNRDLVIYERYKEKLDKLKNVKFLGRLATYRYLDMHHIIEEALDISDQFISRSGI
jgi:UDP-galactopyranose mutase